MEKIFDIAKDSEKSWGVIAQGIDNNFEEQERRNYNDIKLAGEKLTAYINETGKVVLSPSWEAYLIPAFGYDSISAKVYSNNSAFYQIGYFVEKPTYNSIITSGVSSKTGQHEFNETIPEGVNWILVTSRSATATDSEMYAEISLSKTTKEVYRLSQANDDVPFAHNGLKTIWKKSQEWSQGACCVGNNIVGFLSSVGDQRGQMNIINKEDFVRTKVVYHYFGHCNTCDYHEDTDTLVTTRYFDEANPDEVQGIYLVKDFVTKLEGSEIGDIGILISGLTFVQGSLMAACYGESSDILYLCSFVRPFNTNGERYFYKVIMGKGANDLSTVSDGYGTFISGCGDNEYNGTLKLIGTWQGYWLGEIQGLKYINGFLIVSTDLYVDSVLTPYICKVRLEDNGDAKLIANHWIPALSNGNYIKGESEDLAIDETFAWVVVVNVGTYKFPLYGI